MTTHYQIWLSAEQKEDARKILEGLTAKRLIVGGSMVEAPSHFWWKGETVDLKEYCYVMGFTTSEKRKEVEVEYAKLSKEEIPMASFIPMEGNQKFLDYITANVISS